MDLRIVKTKYQIKEAFLMLRDKLTPDKIKIKDLCEAAMINKTTFYKHYTDLTALSDEIDDSAVSNVMSNFKDKDKLFENPKAYTAGLLHSLEREASNLKLVFRGKYDILSAKLEKKLYSCYGSRVKTFEDEIRLSFVIGGCVKVINDYLFTEKKYDMAELIEYTTKIVESLLEQNPVTV